MALGAAGDPTLTERVARATALEMRAMGVNVNYMPLCDLATTPDNPALGIRAFGDSPATVGEHAAAYVRGLQAEGVAATVKHFPGHGDATADTHHGLAVVDASREKLEARELVPFRAAIEAGARLAMSGHVALPGITGDAIYRQASHATSSRASCATTWASVVSRLRMRWTCTQWRRASRRSST